MDRRAHLLEGAATADIGDAGVDVGVGRLRLVLEQLSDGHDHAALAVAALRHVVSIQAFCTLCSTPFFASPSMVVICLPATPLRGTEHERIPPPSTCPVPGPHWPM